MSSFLQDQDKKRIETLKSRLDDNYYLLEAFESRLDETDDPRQVLKYRREIIEVKKDIEALIKEIKDLSEGIPNVEKEAEKNLPAELHVDMSNVEQLLEKLDTKLDRHHAETLIHIDKAHHQTTRLILDSLDEKEQFFVKSIYEAIEQNKIDKTTEENIIQTVKEQLAYTIEVLEGQSEKYKNELEAAINSLKEVEKPKSDAGSSNLVSATKLKISIPLIPFIAKLEKEFKIEYKLPAAPFYKKIAGLIF